MLSPFAMLRLFKPLLPPRLISALAFFASSSAFNAADARVGGGEYFDSGRVSDSSGEGEIISFLLHLLLRILIYEPKIGIPLLVVLLIVAYWVYRKKTSPGERKRLDNIAAQRNTHVNKATTQMWVSSLQKEDSAFQLHRLFEYSRHIFNQIQEAWFQRNLQPVRPFLSDAVFQRLRVQLKLMQQQGVRDAIADWQVLSLQLVGLEKTPLFDVVHLRVDAQIRDTELPWESDDAHALNKARNAPLESFSEVWSLLRKPGVKTRLGWDLVQGLCPNCGAPFSGGASNQCEHCNAIVNSGNYEWVLAEITQASEYLPQNLTPERILEQLRQGDPALSIQALEDKASLCFWRCLESISFQNTSPLSQISTPEFRQHFEKYIKLYEKNPPQYCAVGSVELLKTTSDASRNVDLLLFKIRWSAHFMGRSQPQLWHLELARKRGAKTPALLGLAVFRCPNCHAPLGDSASTRCDYCECLLEAGEADWVLCQAAPTPVSSQNTSTQNKTHAASSQENTHHETLLSLLALLAASDGKAEPQEIQILKSLAERWNVPFSRIELALRVQNTSLFEKLLPQKSEESAEYLRQMVQLIQCDGHIHPTEMKLLQRAAKHWELESLLETLTSRQF
jgi:uncharacterized tellurite resistance protein B-like protein